MKKIIHYSLPVLLLFTARFIALPAVFYHLFIASLMVYYLNLDNENKQYLFGLSLLVFAIPVIEYNQWFEDFFTEASYYTAICAVIGLAIILLYTLRYFAKRPYTSNIDTLKWVVVLASCTYFMGQSIIIDKSLFTYPMGTPFIILLCGPTLLFSRFNSKLTIQRGMRIVLIVLITSMTIFLLVFHVVQKKQLSQAKETSSTLTYPDHFEITCSA